MKLINRILSIVIVLSCLLCAFSPAVNASEDNLVKVAAGGARKATQEQMDYWADKEKTGTPNRTLEEAIAASAPMNATASTNEVSSSEQTNE